MSAKGFLLDTNVISELRRPKPDAHVMEYMEKLPHERSFISAITIAEIEKGIGLAELQ